MVMAELKKIKKENGSSLVTKLLLREEIVEFNTTTQEQKF